MKPTLLFLTLTLFSSATIIAGDSIPTAKIVRLLELSGAEAQFTAAIDQMIGMQKASGTYDELLPGGFWDDFSEEMNKEGFESLLPELIEVYRRNYTEEEIDHQLSYLNHPLTQKLVEKQPTVMQESMQIGAEWGRALGEKIAMRLLEATDRN